jgi:hypothetical protein
MRKFHHFGLPTDQPQSGETYVPATKVHVTDPMQHPQKIEFLRFEPDAELTGPVRDMPHIAYAVDSLEEEMKGTTILLGPFEAMPGLNVVFVEKEGAVVEFMQFSEDVDWGTSGS